jgi:hypothetical protein
MNLDYLQDTPIEIFKQLMREHVPDYIRDEFERVSRSRMGGRRFRLGYDESRIPGETLEVLIPLLKNLCPRERISRRRLERFTSKATCNS